METSSRSTGRLSIGNSGSSSEDRCWKHEVNAIGNTDQNTVYGPAYTTSPPRVDGNGTGHQAPNARGNIADGRPSVNSPGSAPPRVMSRTEPTRRSGEGSDLRTPTTTMNPPRPSVTVQNIQRVQNILNNTDPVLAEAPDFVQLVGQVSEILQQTMLRTKAYREQRSSQSQTMTSSQRSSLSRGSMVGLGISRYQDFLNDSDQGVTRKRLFQTATPSPRREDRSLGPDDV